MMFFRRRPPNPAKLRIGVTISFKEKSVQINLNWTLPTIRTNGVSLAAGDITKVTIVRNGTVLTELGAVTSYADVSPAAGDNAYVVHVGTADGLVSDASNSVTVTIPAAPAAAVTDLSGSLA